jgi:ABC-type enterochelin transport system permease subunit
MLPEKLSFAFAMLITVTLVYLSYIHKWEWEQTMILILLGILGATIVGRVVGVICSRELAKSLAERAKASGEMPGTPKA